MIKVYYKHIYEVIYDISVYSNIFERILHLKVKLRSHQFKCKISMNNCPIAFKFGTEVQSQSKKIPILGECGSYGQIMTIKLNLTK